MTNSFKGIIKLSQSQYEKIINGENLIVNNKEYKYDANIVYIVEDIKVTLDTEQTITGKKDFTGGLTLNGKELIIKDEAVTVADVQDITGNKNFTGLLSYKGKEVAIKEEIPIVSDSLDAEYKDNAMAVNQGIILNEKITALIENVNGKVQSFSAANLEELGNLFGIDIIEAKDEYIVPTSSITYKDKSYNLKTGDIFLIVDVAVPDYWFSLEDMKLFKMETSKVDLSGFVTDEEFEALSEEVSKKADQTSLDETNQNVSSNATKIEELESGKLERTDLPNINGNNEYNSANNFYAPTAKGNYGQLLMSNGTNAPSWTNIPDIQGSVTLSSLLPSEYQEVEYVECDGGQYIDTEVVSNGEDFKMEGNTYAPLDAGRSYNYVFSSKDTIDGPTGLYLYPGSNYDAHGFQVSYPISMFDKYLTVLTHEIFDTFINWQVVLHKEHKAGRKDTLTILTEQGVEHKAEYTSTNNISNAQIILFANGNNTGETTNFAGKAGKFKIYIDGVVQRDLIPCYRKEDDVVGYYDLLNGVFYENVGSRPFVKGPDMPVDTIKQYQFMAQNIYQGTKTLADTYVPLERTISGKTLGKDIQIELSDVQNYEWARKGDLLSRLLQKEYYKSTNILPVYGIGKTIIQRTVEFTRNDDGTITINGKGSDFGTFYLSSFDDVDKQSRMTLDPEKTYRFAVYKISGQITGGYVSEEEYLNDTAASGIRFHFNGSYTSSSVIGVGGYFNATSRSELTDIGIQFSSYYTYENFVIGIRMEEVEPVEGAYLPGKGPIVHQAEMEEAITNIDTTEIDPTVPSYVKAITEEDISNWNNKLDNFTETDPTVPSYVKAITEEDIASWDSKVDANTQSLAYYTLSTGVGSKLELSIDSSTYVMTLKLTNSSGTVLDTKTVDLPLETMVVNAAYNNSTKQITLTLQNGTTTSFSVADLVSGLATQNALNTTNTNVSNLTTRVGTAETNITNLQNNKANASDLANYLPLSGGTLKGNIDLPKDFHLYDKTGNIILYSTGNTSSSLMMLGSEDVTMLINNSSKSIIVQTPNGDDYVALRSELSTYLPLSGGKMTGSIQTDTSDSVALITDGHYSLFDLQANALYLGTTSNYDLILRGKNYRPTYAGPSYEGELAFTSDLSSYYKTDGTNKYVELTDGSGNNTAGYRLVSSFTATVWGNYRLLLSVASRHQGVGLVSIGLSVHGTIDDYKADINYWGSAVQYSDGAWRLCYNASTGLISLYWYYNDYSPCAVSILQKSDWKGDIVNGTWSTSIPASAGTVYKANVNNSTSLNGQAASYYLNYNNLTNKPTIPTVNNATISLTCGVRTVGSFTTNQGTNASLDFAALFLNVIYPVGSIYLSMSNSSPAVVLGGTWVQLSAGYTFWTQTSSFTAGSTISAGLPNITGDFGAKTYSDDTEGTGAFRWSWTDSKVTPSGTNKDKNTRVTFDANRGATKSGIYGNSTTVQPPAYKVYAWRRTA